MRAAIPVFLSYMLISVFAYFSLYASADFYPVSLIYGVLWALLFTLTAVALPRIPSQVLFIASCTLFSVYGMAEHIYYRYFKNVRGRLHGGDYYVHDRIYIPQDKDKRPYLILRLLREEMMNNSFFALAFRQKYIRRWGLMRSVRDETLSEHANDVAVLAHALAVIGNTFYGKNYDTGRVAVCALFHDLPEVYTGDMPTPVKYFNDETKESYRRVEEQAVDRLLSKLPKELRAEYDGVLRCEENEPELRRLIKCADKLSALIKCIEEQRSGNREFDRARAATERALAALTCPELDYFMKNILPYFDLTLDEMQ